MSARSGPAGEGLRFAVIGAGVSGLAAADRLLERAGAGQVRLFEASDRLGGVIATERIGGRPVDLGADSLVTRSPGLPELLAELELVDCLVEPAHGATAVVARGRLRRLPLGVMSGAPDGVMPLVRSGLLGPLGLARAGLDLVLPPTSPEAVGDSLGELIRRRFGSELLENVLDPLIGGIHHARCDELSLEVVAPQFARAAREGRSVLRGLRRQARSAPAPAAPGSSIFVAPAGGVSELTEALEHRISRRGGEISASTPVVAVGPGGGPGRPVEVVTAAGERLEFDRAVIALRPEAASAALSASAPAAAGALRHLGSRPANLALLVFEAVAEERLPAGTNGMLVPAREGGIVRAATWVSRKWPRRGGNETAVVRCSVDSAAAEARDDGTLAGAARADLERRLGPLPPLIESRIVRIEEALAAPRPGHLGAVEELEADLAAVLPSVRLAGPHLRGSGIGACVATARAAADSLLPDHTALG